MVLKCEMRKSTLFIILLFALKLYQVQATDWNQYRGPNGSGLAKDCNPPVNISNENLIWKTLLIPGFSSPSLSEKYIFLTGLSEDRLVTIAVNKADGKLKKSASLAVAEYTSALRLLAKKKEARRKMSNTKNSCVNTVKDSDRNARRQFHSQPAQSSVCQSP